MFQIDNSTAALAPPAPSAPGTPGYFTDGNLQSGVAPTIVPAEFLNAMMSEMLGVLAGAGISPSKTTNNQILLAIKALIRQSADYYQDSGTVANAYVVSGLDPNPELVTNGTFASDLSGWTVQVAGTSSVTWNNNSAQITGDGSHAAVLSWPLTTVPGRVYQVLFDVATNPVIAAIGSVPGAADVYNQNTVLTPVGVANRIQFTATGATSWLTFTRTAAITTNVDNVSVKDTGELVANGTFDTDMTGWTLVNPGTATVAGGVVTVTNAANGTDAFLAQSFPTVPGRTYSASVDVTGPASFLLLGTFSGGNSLAAAFGVAATRLTKTFVATSVTTWVSIGVNSTATNQSATFDNVSVKAAPNSAIPFKFRTTRANTGPATIDIGQGVYPLRTEQGNELAAGDIAANSITNTVFDPVLGYAVVAESVQSQFGALAKENIGQGLEDDGAGALRVKLTDASIRRSPSGVQTNDPITTVTGNTPIVPFSHASTLLVTGAAVTITAPATGTLWNGYNVTVIAKGGPVTFAVNAADKVNGGAAGAGYTVLQGQSVNLVSDGAGNWWPLFQTGVTVAGNFSPLYVTASQTLGAGTYEVDTTAGPISITLPTGIAAGTTLEFSDPFGTWGASPLTLLRNGNTILGLASDLVCDVGGETFRIIYNGSDWRLF